MPAPFPMNPQSVIFREEHPDILYIASERPTAFAQVRRADAPPTRYRVNGSRPLSLTAAKAIAERHFSRTGNIVAITIAK